MRKLLWGAFLLLIWPSIKARISDRVDPRKRARRKAPSRSVKKQAQADRRIRSRNRS